MKYTNEFIAMMKRCAVDTLKELYRGDYSSGNGIYHFTKEEESVTITEEGDTSHTVTYQDIRDSIEDVYHTRLECYETEKMLFSDCALAFLLDNYPEEAEALFS